MENTKKIFNPLIVLIFLLFSCEDPLDSDNEIVVDVPTEVGVTSEIESEVPSIVINISDINQKKRDENHLENFVFDENLFGEDEYYEDLPPTKPGGWGISQSSINVDDFPFWMFFTNKFHDNIDINYGSSLQNWKRYAEMPEGKKTHMEAILFNGEMVIVSRGYEYGSFAINRTINKSMDNWSFSTYYPYSKGWGEPSLVVFNGKLHMIWKGNDCNNCPNAAYYSTSNDGFNWSPIVKISSGIKYDPELLVFGNRLYCFVSKNINGNVGLSVYSSGDGINWKYESRINTGSIAVSDITAVNFKNHIFLFTTDNSFRMYSLRSSDGLRWTFSGGNSYDAHGKIGAIVDGDKIFIASAYSGGTIWTASYSTNGGWSPRVTHGLQTDIGYDKNVSLVKVP